MSQTVKKLAGSIDKLKAELSTSASSKLLDTVAASAGSQVAGSKVTGTTLVRSTKLVRTPTATSSEVSAPVTSSTADVAGAEDKPVEVTSPLDQVTTVIVFTASSHCSVN